jgi:hypothetical protein
LDPDPAKDLKLETIREITKTVCNFILLPISKLPKKLAIFYIKPLKGI